MSAEEWVLERFHEAAEVAARHRRQHRTHDRVILGWNPEALPADWEAVRGRYFAINLIQLVTTWAAFPLFLVAFGYL